MSPQLSVFRELGGENELRGFLGQPSDDDRLDDSFGEALAEPPEILFEAANHDRFELSRLEAHAAHETLWVEDLHQRSEAVRVAVVRRGG